MWNAHTAWLQGEPQLFMMVEKVIEVANLVQERYSVHKVNLTSYCFLPSLPLQIYSHLINVFLHGKNMKETSMSWIQTLIFFLALSLYTLHWTFSTRIQKQFVSGIQLGYITVIFFQLLSSNWRAPNVHHYPQWLPDYAASWASFSKT